MTPQEKRRQHHVWRHYLGAWTDAGRLFCLQEGRIFRTGPRAVAVERYFYWLPPLIAQDYRLIELILLRGGPGLAPKAD